MKFLTFDLGTTLYKVALFDDSGNLLALERAVPPIERPQPQWAEVDTAKFAQVLIDAVTRLRTREDLTDVAAICIATQANSFTLLDKQGAALTPFILWSDQRAQGMTTEPGLSPLLALSKLAWLHRHQPDVLAKAHRLCFIGDYLTGIAATEAGVASIGRIINPRTGEPAYDILDRLALPSIQLPQSVRAGTDLGPFARAEQFGLPKSCRVIVGCLDQYAGAIGTGTVEPGRLCETTGTVLAAVRCADAFREQPPVGVIQGPGFDTNRWWQMSFSSTSANLLEWYRNSLLDKPTFDQFTSLAEAAPPSDLTIEPYDDHGPIESAFRHVRPDHAPGQIVRAIMQRVTLALKEQIDRLCADDRPDMIRSAGGASKNDYWLQMKADALNVAFEATSCEEPTSLGAAMLAAHAVGLGEFPEIAKRWIKVRKQFTPRPI